MDNPPNNCVIDIKFDENKYARYLRKEFCSNRISSEEVVLLEQFWTLGNIKKLINPYIIQTDFQVQLFPGGNRIHIYGIECTSIFQPIFIIDFSIVSIRGDQEFMPYRKKYFRIKVNLVSRFYNFYHKIENLIKIGGCKLIYFKQERGYYPDRSIHFDANCFEPLTPVSRKFITKCFIDYLLTDYFVSKAHPTEFGMTINEMIGEYLPFTSDVLSVRRAYVDVTVANGFLLILKTFGGTIGYNGEKLAFSAHHKIPIFIDLKLKVTIGDLLQIKDYDDEKIKDFQVDLLSLDRIVFQNILQVPSTTINHIFAARKRKIIYVHSFLEEGKLMDKSALAIKRKRDKIINKMKNELYSK